MSITIALAGLQNAIGAPRSGSSLQLLSDDELRRILIARIDRDHQSRGIIVGIVNTAETRFIAHGNLDDVNSGVVATNSSFELGSVTKVFTALLLVDAVRRNEVALGDPAAKYLPSGLKALERNGKYITLEHLATHTSGLPSELNNLARDPSQHRSGEMTVEEANSDKPEDLYRFLSAYELTRDPGMQFEYSNLGMTLLGHILAKRAGTDYSTLLKARILRPMHLAETGGPNAHPRGVQFAVGHDAQLNAAPASHALAGAGGLRSTARDLVRFLKIAMGLSRSSFNPELLPVS